MFKCNQCGARFNHWPIRRGMDPMGFCSAPCFWAWYAWHGMDSALALLMKWAKGRTIPGYMSRVGQFR